MKAFMNKEKRDKVLRENGRKILSARMYNNSKCAMMTISFMCNKCTYGDPPTQFSCPFMDIADANSIVHTIIPGNHTGKKPFELDIKIICYSGVKE